MGIRIERKKSAFCGWCKSGKVILLVTLCVSAILAQQTDSCLYSPCDSALINDLNRPYPDCEMICLNSRNAIRSFYEAGQKDSLRVLMNRWKGLCNLQYTDVYLYYLVNIMLNDFSDTVIDSTFFPHAISYEKRVERENKLPGTDQTDTTYDGFISFLADSLAEATDTTSTEHLITLLIGRKFDRFYNLLRNAKPFKDTRIKMEYDAMVEAVQRPEPIDLLFLFLYPPFPSINGSIGCWFPVGNLSAIGIHPEVGFGLGRRYGRFHGDLFMTFRLMDSENSVAIIANNSVYTSNDFMGIQVGVDLGYTIFRRHRWQLDALVDVGRESISLLKKEESTGIPERTLLSYFGGPGVGVRLFLGKSRKFVVNPQLRYSFLSYGNENKGGTDLSAGAFSFRIVFHNSLYHEDQKLGRLRYFEK